MKSTTCLLLAVSLLLNGPAALATDWLERGVAFYESGRYSEAVQSLSEAVRDQPENDLGHYYLANALMKIGNQSRAIEEYRHAYEFASTREVFRNCLAVFRMYKMDAPPRKRPMPTANRALAPYTTDTVQAINAKAEGKQNNAWVSNTNGVEVFKDAPENDNGMRQLWDQWIYNFRLAFGTRLGAVSRGRIRERMSGSADMVFSVDSQHRLRGKITKASTPESFNRCLIATTQVMDGSPWLTFPPGASIPGYNFTMNWDFGPPALRRMTNTSATLQNTQATLRTNDLNAVAGKLKADNASSSVNGKLRGKDASAQLDAKDVSARALGTNTSADLSEGSLTAAAKSLPANFLPRFSVEVSGRVLPGKVPAPPEPGKAPPASEPAKASPESEPSKVRPPVEPGKQTNQPAQPLLPP